MFGFTPPPALEVAVSSVELAGWVDRLGAVDVAAGDAELIDQIRELERIKSACAAAQAALTAVFVRSRTAGLSSAQLKEEGTHRSIGAQIALARRDSPARGGRHVGLAKVLTSEMPHTFRALRSGVVSEWRATLLVRETACLSIDDRGVVDAELAPRLGQMGDKQTAQAAALIAQRLDARSCVKRHAKAVGDRRVSIRPAPDTMTYLTALLPVAQGVAVYAALTRHADTSTATGDTRGRGQLMADELVHRITTPANQVIGASAGNAARAGRTPEGRSTVTSGAEVSATAGAALPNDADADADALNDIDGVDGIDAASAVPPGVNIDIQLVMTDRTLLDQDDEPAILTGYGPIPGPLARHLVRTAPPEVKTFIRRLYTDPGTRQLITGDTQRRAFTPAMRRFLIARDRTCRTPWCDAPIRHADHITAHYDHFPTMINNGQGLCERCNYVKQAPGWRTTTDPDGTGTTMTTPTGHTAHSKPPPAPRSQPWARTPTTRADIRWTTARLRNIQLAS